MVAANASEIDAISREIEGYTSRVAGLISTLAQLNRDQASVKAWAREIEAPATKMFSCLREGDAVIHCGLVRAMVVTVWADGTADIRPVAGGEIMLDVPVSKLVRA